MELLSIRDLQLFGAAVCLVLTASILSLPRGLKIPNVFLAFFVASKSQYLGTLYFLIRMDAWPPWQTVTFYFYLLGPASLYMYVKSLTDFDFKLTKRDAWHLVLPLVVCVLTALFYEAKLGFSYAMPPTEFLDSHYDTHRNMMMIIPAIIVLYGVLSLRTLKKHRSRLEMSLADLSGINLAWLRYTIISALLLPLMVYGGQLVVASGVWSLALALTFQTCSIILIAFVITMGGLRQPIIFTHDLRTLIRQQGNNRKPVDSVEPASEASSGEEACRQKYMRSSVSNEKMQTLWSEMLDLISQPDIFSDTELNLGMIASALEESPQVVSQTISVKGRCSFYELVNRQRVSAALALLQEPANNRRKLLDIADEVGFKSQSTFHRYFKQEVGYTPSQVRQLIAEGSPDVVGRLTRPDSLKFLTPQESR